MQCDAGSNLQKAAEGCEGLCCKTPSTSLCLERVDQCRAVGLPVSVVVEKMMLRRALSGLQEVIQIFLLFFHSRLRSACGTLDFPRAFSSKRGEAVLDHRVFFFFKIIFLGRGGGGVELSRCLKTNCSHLDGDQAVLWPPKHTELCDTAL